MKRYDSFNFNPRQIEKHLSPFGQQVLKTLIKQRRTENERNRKNLLIEQTRHCAQNRVITFGEPHSADVTHRINTAHRPHTSSSSHFEVTVTDDKLPSNYPAFAAQSEISTTHTETLLPSIPTSAELAEESLPVSNAIEQTEHDVTRDDLITTIDRNLPTNQTITARNILNEIYGSSDDEEVGIKLDSIVSTKNKDCNILDNSECSDNVNWGDMFDSELFTEANAQIDRAEETKDSGNIRDGNIFDFNFPYASYNLEEGQRDSFKKPQDPFKKTKRKNQITDSVSTSKKAKKVKNDAPKSNSSKKNSFRKEKYTKTVKKWLNDVDPNNPIEEDSSEDIENKPEKVNKNDKVKKVTENNPKENNVKRVVQSQLANKGGVMKFVKPKNIHKVEDKFIEPGPSTIDSIETIVKETKTKEKKSKPKFVAPIKSQIPVKDIVYDVHVVDEINAEQHLFDVKDKEITIILLYSNGFCQLSSQHTDDSCVPEAVMCCIDDSYFCFKGSGLKTGEILAAVLRNNTIVCYDGKALLIYIMSKYNWQFDTTLNIIDTKISGSLLEPDNPPENFSELQKVASYTIQYTVATECTKQKAAWYISVLRDCAAALRTLLQDNSLWNVFVDIEMKILPIIAEMEHTGIRVDMESLKSMESILLSKMKQVEAECHKAAGKSFQITSTQQVRGILYDELQLDTRTNIKIKETVARGAKSTSETMLRSLVSVHPLPALILEYRRLHKAHATFLAGIATHVKDGIIRPTWVQTAAATGRIACSNPNLQAIPKAPFSLVNIPGDCANGSESPEGSMCLRDVYVSREGRSLVAADFRQVESRVFARAAADEALQRALAAPDLFRVLAAQWLEKSEEDVSEADRERTKRIVYASLYGAGTHKLMDILGVDYQRALAVTASFNRTFPSLRSFGRETAEACVSEGGAVRTLCGRARRLPLVASRDAALRGHAHRQAVNFIVQGTAADLCKLAMAATVRRLRAHRPALAARLLLQIHDELVWELPHHQIHVAARLIKEVMEGCGARAGFATLPVSLYTGRTWGHLEPYAVPGEDN